MVTFAPRRRAVSHLMEAHGMSERRAYKATGFCRMTMRYRTTHGNDASLRERMKAIPPGATAVRVPASPRPAQAGALPGQPQAAVPALP